MSSEIPADMRAAVLDRDGRRCRHSGDTEGIEVYLIDPDKPTMRYDPSNLITLSARMRDRALRVSRESAKTKCGVLLAGGRGTRLAPLTLFMNKHELPVGGVPMIFKPLLTLRTLGIHDVMIILDRENSSEHFITMLGDGSEFGLSITYRVQQGPSGIAAALMLARDFVKERRCYVILGDNIFDEDEFENWQEPNWVKEVGTIDGACIFVKRVSNPKEYGIIDQYEGHLVLSIIEKPSDPPTDLAVVGLYIYPHTVFDMISALKPSERGELEITDVNNFYCKKRLLISREVRGFWGDAGGSKDSFLRVNEHMVRS